MRAMGGLSEVQGAIDKLRGEHVNLAEQISAKDDQIDQLKRLIEKLHQRLKESKNKSNGTAESLTQRLKVAQHQSDNLRATLENYKTELQELKRMIISKDKELAYLRSSTADQEDLRLQNQRLEQKLLEQKRSEKSLADDLSRESHKVKQLLMSYETVSEEVKWLRSEIESNKGSNSTLERSLMFSEEEKKRLQKDNDRLREEIAQLKKKQATMYTGDELRREVEMMKQRLHALLSQDRQHISQLDSYIDMLKTSIVEPTPPVKTQLQSTTTTIRREQRSSYEENNKEPDFY